MFIKILLAIFLPPIAVLLEKGVSGAFVLNIILTLIGGLPGMVHAVWVVADGGDRKQLTP